MLVGIQSIGGIAAVALGAVHADAITALSAYLGAPTLGEFTVIGLYIGFSTKEDQWMQQMADKVA